jgi:putative endonuclease
MDGADVYLLRCADGSLYCGSTRKDVSERVCEHQNGHFASCYTFKRRPVTLAWSEHFASITDAIAVERQIKGWTRAKKEALIAGDWSALHRLAQCLNETRSPKAGLNGVEGGSGAG